MADNLNNKDSVDWECDESTPHLCDSQESRDIQEIPKFAVCIERLASESNLRAAFEEVKKNKGAPGIDEQSVYDVESKLKQIIPTLHRELLEMNQNIEQQLEFIGKEEFIRAIGLPMLPGLLGKVISQVPEDKAIRDLLNEIPSETSAAERYALYHWFRYLWSGEGDCLEIGPFLGGTSRAIALGMLQNSYRKPSTKLRTVDKFASYYRGDSLVRFLDGLFATGKLPIEWRGRLQGSETVQFYELYHFLHMSTQYAGLLEIEEGSLPDRPEELTKGTDCYRPQLSSPLTALFIDGCKSWFSIKYLMSSLEGYLPTGSFVISQDCGWFTCFWLPIFFEIFADHFELLSCVDTSYFFRVIKPLSNAEIEERFPNHPREFGERAITKLFNTLAQKAAIRGDLQMLVSADLQLACALAVLGEIATAYRVITDLKSRPYAQPMAKTIQRAIEVLNCKFVLDPEETHMANG